jgi:hypothetical protein
MLCLAIPLQGIAGIAVIKTSCPMKQMSVDTMSTSAMTPAMPDCCNDANTFAKTGKACKSGQQCQSNNPFSALILNYQFSTSVQTVHLPHAVTAIHSLDPSSVWRPPSQI